MEAHDLSPDPLRQFELWLEEARASDSLEFPNAVALATASRAGRPSVRMVLFKGLNKNGFTFFTNTESRKGQQLAENPFAALCFYWEATGRQVRVEGRIEILPPTDSDDYFRLRPRGSQLGAWASPQSREIGSRAELIDRVRELNERYPGEIPRPPFWSGYRLVPDRIEFWENGENRLHDRFEYTPSGSEWNSRRLAP